MLELASFMCSSGISQNWQGCYVQFDAFTLSLSALPGFFPFSGASVSSDAVLWVFETNLQLKAIEKEIETSPRATKLFQVLILFQFLLVFLGSSVLQFCLFSPRVYIVNYGSWDLEKLFSYC